MATSGGKLSAGSRTLVAAAESAAARAPWLGRLAISQPVVLGVYLVAYLALDWLSFIHALHGIGITPWNPSPGLSVALLLAQGVRYAPALAVAAALSGLALASVPVPVPALVASALIIAGGYATAAFVLTRIVGFDVGLRQTRDVIALLGVAIASAACVALGFVAIYAWAGVIPWHDYGEAVFQYWMGDAIGIAVFTPPLLLLVGRFRASVRRSWRLVDSLEAAAQALSLVLALAAVFGLGGEPFKYFYLLFLPLIWISVRHGLVGASWAVFAIQAGMIVELEVLEQSVETVRAFQLLMFAVAITGLLLGSVVSEHRRAIRALQESEDRLDAVLRAAPDAVITIDSDGRIEGANPMAERMFGATAAHLHGRNIADLIELPHAATAASTFFAVTPEGAGGRECVAQRAGKPFSIELTVGRIARSDTPRYALFIRDITQRKEAEARAREHQEELAHVSRQSLAGEMASALAHELNQPLTAIMAYTQGCARLLDEPEPDRALAREAFGEVVEQAERAGAIINRLREFLRQGTSHRSTISIGELVTEALALARPEATQNGIDIRVHLAADLPVVVVDRIQIEQVLINLVRNAIEAIVASSSFRREISIEGRAVPEGAEITVSDTGPGVPDELAARLFEPFVTTKPRGMGLGLPISRSIAEAHDGRLQLIRVRDGAVFSLILPSEGPDDDRGQ